MDTATARASVKTRLDIPSSTTDFDDAIDEFVLAAVDRLYPIAQKELDPEEVSASVDNYGEAIVDLSVLSGTPTAARKVEVKTSYQYESADDFYHQNQKMYVRELPTGQTVTLRVFPLGLYELSTVPAYLKQAIFWYAMSEFYDFLAGNKSKYNLYVSNGARSVDNMRDESEYYEQKANVYLNDRVTIYGAA